ncbi:mitochondrial porin-like protein [Lophium mytilinum]|uniref:Mitochondrial porin-like protein n=1 Tax=Lophium mytilinum TaxID=390894 RepID=A0A6A6QEU8_9PEZI|nr:mitochondrial porin-like protein [Lophium mytilinum]
MSIPAFSDIAKPSNDLINKDFYHVAAAALEVKLKTPDGVNFTAKGTSAHDGPISSSIEAKKGIQNGTYFHSFSTASIPVYSSPTTHISLLSVLSPSWRQISLHTQLTRNGAGISIIQSWNTANVLNTKVELADSFAKDLKVEVLNNFSPASGNKGQKLNIYFKQQQFHSRAFLDYQPSGKVTALADIVLGHEGFLVGGEAAYDVQKAALTKYSAAVGYSTPTYTAAITATNSFNIFAASYYHKVNKSVEAGTKATYDAKTGTAVGIELASKYKIDPLSFAKAKINDRGIASIAYNTKINSGLTFGIGGSFDTQKFNEAGHKFGTSFTFEG